MRRDMRCIRCRVHWMRLAIMQRVRLSKQYLRCFFALRADDVFFVALRAAVVAVVFFALRAVEFCIALRAAVVWMAVLRALDVFLMLVLRALFSVLSARAVETRLVSVERVTIFFTLSVVALRATE